MAVLTPDRATMIRWHKIRREAGDARLMLGPDGDDDDDDADGGLRIGIFPLAPLTLRTLNLPKDNQLN